MVNGPAWQSRAKEPREAWQAYTGYEDNPVNMIEPLTDLANGIEILDPFLKLYDFRFENYDTFHGLGSHFTFAIYKNRHKEFHLGYHYSIGHILYQYDDKVVSHNFYLERLGYGQKKQFREAQTEDKLIAFSNVLYDFNFLVDDFFQGECLRLKEFSILHENIIAEYDKKAREGYNIEFDALRIEKARLEFRKKEFQTSLELYRSVDYKNMLNALDEKIIEFCERHSLRGNSAETTPGGTF